MCTGNKCPAWSRLRVLLAPQCEAAGAAHGEAVDKLQAESGDMHEALGQLMDMIESTATQQDLADAQVPAVD